MCFTSLRGYFPVWRRHFICGEQGYRVLTLEQIETPEQLNLCCKEKGSKDKVDQISLSFSFYVFSIPSQPIILEVSVVLNFHFVYLLSRLSPFYLSEMTTAQILLRATILVMVIPKLKVKKSSP